MTAADRASGVTGADFAEVVLDTAGCLVAVVDLAGRIQVFNRMCEQVSGYRADEVLGRPFWEVGLRPDQADAAREAFAGVTADDFPHLTEEDWITRDGQVRRVRWTCTALVDAAGLLRDVIATGLDVTDQRRTERMFANVLAATTEQAIFATDPDGTIVVFNTGAEHLLGYTAAELVGTSTLRRLYLPEEVAARAADLGVEPGAEVFTRAARQGRADTREWVMVRKDGSQVPVSTSISAMRDDAGQLLGFVATARDVTAERRAAIAVEHALRRERAAAAHLQELNEIKTSFVANVSHELRTPLTNIIGATEIILDERPGDRDPALGRMLGMVDRNARRLQVLVHDLLAVSHIESGAIKMNAWPVAAGTLIADAIDVLADYRGRRDVALTVEVPDEPLCVNGDGPHLTRAVANVIGNALKFTPDGGRVQVTASGLPNQVVIGVSDNGIGIPHDEVDRVFDRFYRSSRSRRDEAVGTGLGLAITKSILEQHGGTIEIAAPDGGGTTVTLWLPRSPVSVGRPSAGRP